jgi:hypothetical protein
VMALPAQTKRRGGEGPRCVGATANSSKMAWLPFAALLLVQALTGGVSTPPPGDLLPAYPRFHLSLARFDTVAINDPNGVQWLNGRWHYFFQRHDGDWAHPAPGGTVGFGHVTSPDLLHWTLQPPAIVPGQDGFDAGGVWSGGGFSTEDGAGARHMGVTYRALGSGRVPSGVAVAVSRGSDPENYTGNCTTRWQKLGVLFPRAEGDGMPIWRTLDGRWHGGGAVDTSATQRGHTTTYTSAPTATDAFPSSPQAWTADARSLLDVTAMAPNWPGSTCCCPDFVPAYPPDTASPQPSSSAIWAA